jgi:hypothetical protein
MKYTRAEWEAKGRELFGEEQEKWSFACPTCKRVSSIASVRAEFADQLPLLRAREYSVYQECIGRHLPGVGCDWAAYGLFRGPSFVDDTPVFDFAEPPAADAAPRGGG